MVTRKPVVSDTKDLTTATITCNDKKYKWWTSCKKDHGAWGFQWKDGHEESKIIQGKKPYVSFSNPATNEVVYWSYLMSTREESIEEESKGGDDSQNDDFISMSRFELLEWLLKRAVSPLLQNCYYLIISMWPWISLERDSCWRWNLMTISSQFISPI